MTLFTIFGIDIDLQTVLGYLVGYLIFDAIKSFVMTHLRKSGAVATTDDAEAMRITILELRAAILEAEGCFDAARLEGWIDAVENGDNDQIRDLWYRRLSHATNPFEGALARSAVFVPGNSAHCRHHSSGRHSWRMTRFDIDCGCDNKSADDKCRLPIMFCEHCGMSDRGANSKSAEIRQICTKLNEACGNA